MLVLTRKQQQQIQIGDGITITILKVKGNTVRVGIEAPSDVKIVRAELEPEHPKGSQSPADTRLDTIESVDTGSASSQQEGESRVYSFRIRPGDLAQSNTPRAINMREFLASRNVTAGN